MALQQAVNTIDEDTVIDGGGGGGGTGATTWSVSGYVLDEDSLPIFGASVFIQLNSGGYNYTRQTDRNGYFVKTGMPYPSGEVTVSYTGYENASDNFTRYDNNLHIILTRLAVQNNMTITITFYKQTNTAKTLINGEEIVVYLNEDAPLYVHRSSYSVLVTDIAVIKAIYQDKTVTHIFSYVAGNNVTYDYIFDMTDSGGGTGGDDTGGETGESTTYTYTFKIMFNGTQISPSYYKIINNDTNISYGSVANLTLPPYQNIKCELLDSTVYFYKLWAGNNYISSVKQLPARNDTIIINFTSVKKPLTLTVKDGETTLSSSDYLVDPSIDEGVSLGVQYTVYRSGKSQSFKYVVTNNPTNLTRTITFNTTQPSGGGGEGEGQQTSNNHGNVGDLYYIHQGIWKPARKKVN